FRLATGRACPRQTEAAGAALRRPSDARAWKNRQRQLGLGGGGRRKRRRMRRRRGEEMGRRPVRDRRRLLGQPSGESRTPAPGKIASGSWASAEGGGGGGGGGGGRGGGDGSQACTRQTGAAGTWRSSPSPCPPSQGQKPCESRNTQGEHSPPVVLRASGSRKIASGSRGRGRRGAGAAGGGPRHRGPSNDYRRGRPQPGSRPQKDPAGGNASPPTACRRTTSSREGGEERRGGGAAAGEGGAFSGPRKSPIASLARAANRDDSSASSSQGGPNSTTRPASSTRMRSAPTTVCSLCVSRHRARAEPGAEGLLYPLVRRRVD
ncbi:unnamed protein product, partial [Prorocentrum cordatum]